MPKAQNRVRPALLAGQWYPDDATTCKRAIAGYANGVEPTLGRRGLIAPHAGWTYSGATAARGYAALDAQPDTVDLVVLFGSHRGAQGPNTVFRGAAWSTPLGDIEVASDLADALAEGATLADEPILPQRPDNGVELHLPFVRYFFPRARLLMAGVAAAEIALTIGRRAGELALAAGGKTVFVGSTDLTHYGPNYGFAPRGEGANAVAWVRNENDRGFVARVLANDAPGALAHAEQNASACCPGAVAATLAALAAYGHPSKAELVDHCLSCDRHPSASFVGYASIIL